ncbi:cold shock domain-containing protein [Pseudoroseomonas wenyumeiae]|uniref:Cold shock domain-containing protein n=1 Tax=Teichococcus wenyumeiae TaxID=2478470 RepID=A0A3A9JKM2_9PROT|nr:cold shock domain-containing protein [Pseudoroseomonas wenyumeiae]RKK05333.1 cold shock domain-containing protein [Pseudoroseomonas wenyumeiae]RMI25536.1 cold shock domain-containing protein [Pseudoroseomonas wenyumeiae]
MLPDNDSQGGTGPIEAEVKWYNGRKGFGFVLGPDGQDVFFHASALTEAGIEPPETGDKLVCEIGSDRQGRRLVTKIHERKLGPGGGDRPPRRDFGGDRFGDRPPRRDFGDRPPRRDFGAPGGFGGGGGFGDRPPRRDFGGGDRFGGGGGFGDRPPRRDFGGGDRFGGGGGGFGAPRSFGDRPPPRRDFGRDDSGPTYAVNGTVKWFDQVRGFGFVTPDDGGQDVFLHSSVLQRAGKQDVQQGEKVALEVKDGQRGRQAVVMKD